MLRVHHVVGSTVRLAGDHRELGDGRLAIGEQQLGTVLDDPAMLLRHPGRKPGTSSKVTSGMLNASQNRMNRAPLREH